MRPDDNVAVRAGYVFSDPEDVVGRISRTSVDRGQEILDSMLALSTVDLATMGSDLALYVNQGNVAIAFPIDRYTGAAYALRPGDMVDVLATVGVIDIDPDFRRPYPTSTVQSARFSCRKAAPSSSTGSGRAPGGNPGR
jgi:Flp pilus assembly protein CpaB